MNEKTLSSIPDGTFISIEEFFKDLILKNSLSLDSILNCSVERIFPKPLVLKEFSSQLF